jgi:uncharacterized protein affecting Mg2+/Co2+ transport
MPATSIPARSQWFFAYQVTITNTSEHVVSGCCVAAGGTGTGCNQDLSGSGRQAGIHGGGHMQAHGSIPLHMHSSMYQSMYHALKSATKSL